jgi:hypothetical protein
MSTWTLGKVAVPFLRRRHGRASSIRCEFPVWRHEPERLTFTPAFVGLVIVASP